MPMGNEATSAAAPKSADAKRRHKMWVKSGRSLGEVWLRWLGLGDFAKIVAVVFGG